MKKFFRKHPLGRTLSLRNKTGKGIASVALGIVGVKTGVDLGGLAEAAPVLQPLVETTWTQILIMVVGFMSSIAAARWGLSEVLLKEIRDVAEVYIRAKDPNSEDGANLSEKEKAALFDEIGDVVEVIMNKHGKTTEPKE